MEICVLRTCISCWLLHGYTARPVGKQDRACFPFRPRVRREAGLEVATGLKARKKQEVHLHLGTGGVVVAVCDSAPWLGRHVLANGEAPE